VSRNTQSSSFILAQEKVTCLVSRLSDSTARHARHDKRDSFTTRVQGRRQRGLRWTCPSHFSRSSWDWCKSRAQKTKLVHASTTASSSSAVLEQAWRDTYTINVIIIIIKNLAWFFFSSLVRPKNWYVVHLAVRVRFYLAAVIVFVTIFVPQKHRHTPSRRGDGYNSPTSVDVGRTSSQYTRCGIMLLWSRVRPHWAIYIYKHRVSRSLVAWLHFRVWLSADQTFMGSTSVNVGD